MVKCLLCGCADSAHEAHSADCDTRIIARTEALVHRVGELNRRKAWHLGSQLPTPKWAKDMERRMRIGGGLGRVDVERLFEAMWLYRTALRYAVANPLEVSRIMSTGRRMRHWLKVAADELAIEDLAAVDDYPEV